MNLGFIALWSGQASTVREHGWSSTLLMVDGGLFLILFILLIHVERHSPCF